ncbi:MAG: BtrH N-terminal domain-containing protein, partial [Dongiaceae bacterium]
MIALPGFVHRPGVHCGSTSMADVLRHQGLELSEPMCFGLGSGLHLVYLRDFGVPSR